MDHRPDLIIGDVFEAVGDVFTDGSREKDRVLGNNGDLFPVFVHIEVYHIDPVDEDFAVCGRQKTNQKVQNRGLSGAGFSGKGDALAGFDLQVKILQNISFPIGIFEIHVAETDVSLEVAQRDDGMVGLHLLFFENIADGTDGLHSLAEIRVNIDESGDLSDDLSEIGLEQNHLADADLSLDSQTAGEGQAEDLEALENDPAGSAEKVVHQIELKALMHDALEVTLHFVDLHLLQTVGSRDGNHLKHFRHRALGALHLGTEGAVTLGNRLLEIVDSGHSHRNRSQKDDEDQGAVIEGDSRGDDDVQNEEKQCPDHLV